MSAATGAARAARTSGAPPRAQHCRRLARRTTRGRTRADRNPPGSPAPSSPAATPRDGPAHRAGLRTSFLEPCRGTRTIGSTADNAARRRRRSAPAGRRSRGASSQSWFMSARSRASSCSATQPSGPSSPMGRSSAGGRLPLALGPNELTAKIAPSGACSARAWRVIPYRSSTSRSTNSAERAGSVCLCLRPGPRYSPAPGRTWSTSSATGRPMLRSSERSM